LRFSYTLLLNTFLILPADNPWYISFTPLNL